ncbi:MAG: hypothetical protein ACE5EN_10535 [Nitrospinota bacterium]
MKLTAEKKRVLRKQLLQLTRELYLHPQSDAAIKASLKRNIPGLTIEQVRETIGYLAEKGLVTELKDKSRLSASITPKGIDVIEGAVSVRGIQTSSGRFARLGYKKELRRGILIYCYSFHDFFNEDTEILQEFRQSGFSNLLMEEMRFHMWYLGEKSLLELKTPEIEGDALFLARITAKGMDVLDNYVSDPGVSHD